MAHLDNPKLAAYRRKRERSSTPEPFGRLYIPATGRLFVVQQHAASHLHFDLRLEVDGVLKSWAVPKGPSDDPHDKRFAVETEDHPLDYADFEGEIPSGNYGAGQVIVWDRGTYSLSGDYADGYARGKLLFDLNGYKLRGRWTLVRLKTRDSTGREWLLIKEQDAYTSDAGPTFAATSVLSGLPVTELGKPRPARRLAALLKKSGAPRAPLTRGATRPMLASAGDAHDRKGWLWELKYDGYRILADKDGASIRLMTRNGLDLAERFPEICQVLRHLPWRRLLLDGELVVNDATGRPTFALMQQRARASSRHEIARAAIETRATYYAFDALALEGHDLRELPLTERKRLLRVVIPEAAALVYSEHVANSGRKTFQSAQQLGIEGVVGKRAQSPYRQGRSTDWIKVRNQRSGEFIIAGFSGGTGQPPDPDDIASLALAEWRGDVLAYAGHAGSGLSGALRRELARRLRTLRRKTSPMQDTPRLRKATQWVRPKLVVEIAFTEYTTVGHLRHPVVTRMRDDKTPDACISTMDLPPAPTTDLAVAEDGPTVVTTNPDKVFFPDAPGKPDGYTKADVVDYYRHIAPWMLPWLAERPIVLTRFPDGVNGKSFYQRDAPDHAPDWLRREVLWSESGEKEIAYFIVRTAQDLAYLANMGTLPIHMWHARLSDLDHPDWCVLDLDPKTAPFTDVIRLAQAIGQLCDEVDLPAFPKTSGASGLHVLLPLGGQLDHAQSQTLGELLANIIVQRHPDIATVARTVRARHNKVYVDYLQNGHGRLIVAPFAVRAEPAASVSMPLKWHEVNAGLTNARFHIGNARARLRRMGHDPLAAVFDTQPDLVRSLSKLMKISGRD